MALELIHFSSFHLYKVSERYALKFSVQGLLVHIFPLQR